MCFDWYQRAGGKGQAAGANEKVVCGRSRCRQRKAVNGLAVPSVGRRLGVVTNLATRGLWRDRDQLVRGKMTEIGRVSVHEVSVTVCRLGLGSRMATTVIRPR